MAGRPVPPARHPNWCRCPACRADIARFESAQWNRTLAIAAFLAVIGGTIWLAKVMVHAWHIWAVLALVPVAAVLVRIVLRVTREPAPALPGAAGAAEIATEAVPPQPPPCLHLNAVRVESITDPDVTVAYWCVECETQLDEDFGRLPRSCCTTPPGGPHARNCPL